MTAKANYFRIGAFILSALIIGVIAIVLLSGGRWFKNVTYWESYFDESVQGLAIGAPIKYRGVQIGTVDAIDFVGDVYGPGLSIEDRQRYGRYVRVSGAATHVAPHLSQEEQQAARANSIVAGLRLRLTSQGVTGVVYLEADYFDPREYPAMEIPWTPLYEYVPSAPSTVTVLSSALHNIAKNLEQTNVHQLAVDLDTFLIDLSKLVKETNLQQLTREVGRTLDEFRDMARQIRRIAENPEIRTMISDVAGTAEETRHLVTDLSQAAKQIKIVSERFPNAFARLERTSQRIDELVSNKSQDIEETVENLRMMSENIRELTDNAKRYPAQIFLGEPPPRSRSSKR